MTPAIVSVHYHLRPGGVTQVIRSTERILRNAAVSHLVVSGDKGMPELDYDPGGKGDLSAALQRFATAQLGDRPRVWHFHNPCLGRNPALTRSLQTLAEAGEAMILQHHDLAEDGRPANLAILDSVADPYPDSPRIAHAFLNARDRSTFIRAGLPEERAVLLPNPAPNLPPLPAPPAGPALVLLPMRGIPRKNLGEMLLLAAAAPKGTRFLQGSAPSRDEWKPAYASWRRLAKEQGLPVEFDAFSREAPGDCFARCTHLLTTSTQEGFGLVHLEGANRRRVMGRRIPYLDLEGFPLDGLYDAIIVNGLDFAILDDDAQGQAVRALRNETLDAGVVKQGQTTPIRDWLDDQLRESTPADASAGLARHSDAAHLRRLTGLRDRLLRAEPGPVRQLDRRVIAAAFA